MIDPPDGVFGVPCDWHDFEYWRGGTEVDRYDSDLGFYTFMKERTRTLSRWRRPFARLRAWLYYKAVRLFAKPYFHYGEPRGWEALEALRETARLRNEDRA